MPDFLVPIVIGIAAGFVLYGVIKKLFPGAIKF